MLVKEQPLALYRQVGHVDAVHALVGTHPDVIAIAFHDAVHGELVCHDEVLLIA